MNHHRVAHVVNNEPYVTTSDCGRFRFRAQIYRFVPDWSHTDHTDDRKWILVGPKLNQDGTEHGSGHTCSIDLDPTNVPEYVKQAAAAHYRAMARDYAAEFNRLAELALMSPNS